MLNRLKNALEICNQYPNDDIINVQKNKIIEILGNKSTVYQNVIIDMKKSDIFDLKK